MGDLVQQGVEGLMLAAAVREGVSPLLDQGGMPFGQDAPGKRAGLVAQDDRRAGSGSRAGAAVGLIACGVRSLLCHGVQALRLSLICP
ncbi:hypothetical protein ACFWBX_19810 [Streptomyces sp. NPDC059991]|uniref:hypothetical protein n=1 Tax=Streptomyces sp. NPDC059991 TaxID=3347028 RepID=UPI003674F662